MMISPLSRSTETTDDVNPAGKVSFDATRRFDATVSWRWNGVLLKNERLPCHSVAL